MGMWEGIGSFQEILKRPRQFSANLTAYQCKCTKIGYLDHEVPGIVPAQYLPGI